MAAAAVTASARVALAGPATSSSSSSSLVRVTLHYLGPPGTYSHQVALSLAPRIRLRRSEGDSDGDGYVFRDEDQDRPTAASFDVQLQPCDTIRDTVRQAQRSAAAHDKQNSGRVDGDAVFLALLPYENNSNGPVTDSYDIVHTASDNLDVIGGSVRVVGEAYLPVSHSLLVTHATEQRLKAGRSKVEKTDLVNLRRISSHVQALGQCSLFIQQHMSKSVELCETTSTGEAARLLIQAQENGHAEADDKRDIETSGPMDACIASSVCVHPDVYDLVEVFSDIQNSHGNTTRFLLCQVSSKDDKARPSGRVRVAPDTEAASLPSCARALFRISSNSNSSSLLTTCLAMLVVGTAELLITIRKVDRHATRVEEAGVQANSAAAAAAGGEGCWTSSYVIEVEARRRTIDDDDDDRTHSDAGDETRKRRKIDGSHSSALDAIDVAQELEQLAKHMQSKVMPLQLGRVWCLGSWTV